MNSQSAVAISRQSQNKMTNFNISTCLIHDDMWFYIKTVLRLCVDEFDNLSDIYAIIVCADDLSFGVF